MLIRYFFRLFWGRGGKREAGVGVEGDSGRHTCLALQARFVLPWKTRQNGAPVLQAIATVIVLVTPCGKREVLEQEQKVESTKNLTCDQALFFSGNGIAQKSANEEREKENAVLFSSPPKQKRKKDRLTVVYQKPKKATEYKWVVNTNLPIRNIWNACHGWNQE